MLYNTAKSFIVIMFSRLTNHRVILLFSLIYNLQIGSNFMKII